MACPSWPARRPERHSRLAGSPGHAAGPAGAQAAPRSDDPLAGVTVPVSSGANPAAGEVSHIQQINAELTAQLPVPNEQLRNAPVLPGQHTPADYHQYTSARTAIWKATREPAARPPGSAPR